MSDKTETQAAAEAADQPADGMAMYPIFEVIVERSNNEKIVVEVPEYEVPVLQFLHGEEAVTKGEEAAFEDERPADAAAILAALKRKYNNPNTGDVVSAVYRNAEELGKSAGIKVGKTSRPAASLQVDNRKAAKKSAKK